MIPTWWQDAVAYQIYPRSFADANGDGIGDLPGIIDKLDYLRDLGVTVLWLSPFYPSPQFDVGYDIADYTAVEPDYGTLADFDRLVAEADRRGIRLLLDLVLNHTSDQHPWFLESRSSREHPKRDWYIWRDGRDGGPPNDWEATFGGSAWQYDEATGQYYYHFFFAEQPDLNWRNPEVRQAMFDAVRFWLDRGAAGFRLDALGTLFETESLPDSGYDKTIAELMLERFQHGRTPDLQGRFRRKFIHQRDLPETFDLMRQLRAVCDECEGRILLGETEEVAYYGNGGDMLHSVFNFDLTDVNDLAPDRIRAVLAERLPHLPDGTWETNTIGNHDRPRAMDFFADGRDDRARMAVALAMTMFLRGTPMFYNGEEIGMRNVHMTRIEDFRDMLGVWAYHFVIEHAGYDPARALVVGDTVSRDKGRTPLQWANAPNAGFSPAGVATWLPVHPNYAAGVNVADQQADPGSLLHMFRRLAQVRRDHVALRRGSMDVVPDTGAALVFWRRHAAQTCLVALNMGAAPLQLTIEGADGLRTLFSSQDRSAASVAGTLALGPYEIYVGELGN